MALPTRSGEPIAYSDSSSLEPGLPEGVLLELRFRDLVVRTVQAFRVGDDALLPLTQFLEMAEIRATLSPAGRLEAMIYPNKIALVVDVARDTAELGQRRVAVPPELIVSRGGELYLSAAVVGRLFELDIIVNWADLEVVVLDPSRLPVALEKKRSDARAAFLRRAEETPPDRTPGAARRWDGFVLDYWWSAPGSDPFAGSSYAVTAGTNLLGGSLELGASSMGEIRSGDVRVDASWLGVWRSNPWLKQLRLGDGLATGPRARTMRGASVTNAPFVRPSLLGAVPFTGNLPPGWQVEAYQGGELIAFDSAVAGEFEVSVPVSYGQNPVEFVAYGPSGEARRFSKTYLAAGGLLPARRFEYGVSAGECRSSVCQATANLDLRYGISRRWTVHGGAERYWRDTLPGLTHPYVGVTGNVTNAVSVHAERVERAMTRGGATYEPTPDFRLSADYARFDSGVVAPLLTLPGSRSNLGLFAFLRPSRRNDSWYFEGRADRTQTASSTVDVARVGMSTATGGVRLLPFARVERRAFAGVPTETRSYWGLNSYIAPGPRSGAFLRHLFIRTGFEAEKIKPAAVSLSVGRQITSQVRLEAGTDWRRGFGDPSINLQLTSYFSAVRSHTNVTGEVGGETTLNQLVQGSAVYNRSNGRVHFTADPSVQRSGVTGRVFLDRNGSGRYDPDEPVLPGVRVRVGTYSAISDSSGVYHLWDIVPFEAVTVTVDSLTLESPLWIPGRAAASVVAPPNTYAPLDIPVLVGGVIEGTVMREVAGGRQGVGGVALAIRNRTTGERRSFTSFTDGSFYLLGVRPGEYDLMVEPHVLDLLSVRAESRRFAINADGELEPQLLELVLAPAAGTLADGAR